MHVITITIWINSRSIAREINPNWYEPVMLQMQNHNVIVRTTFWSFGWLTRIRTTMCLSTGINNDD